MNYKIKPDETRLHIYHEGNKRRIFVGELLYHKNNDIYELIYDKKYAASAIAIPLGPNLDLFKLSHYSAKGQLFPIFLDRIPERSNPAYRDYCESQGIDIDETNPITLLGSIGRRGPSTFIFEPVYKNEFHISDILNFREKLKISQHDLAVAFDINEATLQRVETGLSEDINTLKRLQIYFEFPEVALWQLKQTGSRLHHNVLTKLVQHFKSLK